MRRAALPLAGVRQVSARTWLAWTVAIAAAAWLLWRWRSGWSQNEAAALLVAGVAGAVAWRVGPPAVVIERWPRLLTAERLVAGGGLLFVAVSGGFAVARWLSFNASRDLALMDQLAWNTARGAWLEGTFWTGEPLNYLGGHVSPILTVLGPLYWVAPTPAALLVVQSMAVAVAAIFFFLAARKMTGRTWFALGLAVVIFLHPRLHTGLLSDFRQDGFGLMFMAMGLYGLLAGKRGWTIAGVGLSLLVKEEIALYWLIFGLVLGVAQPAERRRFLGVAAVATLWLVIAMGYIRPAFAPATASAGWLFSRYADFGTDPATVLFNVVTRPAHTLQILAAPGRVLGVLVTLMPYVFLWRHARWWHLFLLAPLGINLLSVDGVQHRLLGHYALLPLAAVALVTLLAAGRRAEKGDGRSWARLTTAVVAAGVVLYLWLSPIGLRVRQTAVHYRVDAHDRQGALIAGRIPPESVVVAQASIATHLAQRPYLTIFPIETGPRPDYYVFDLAESTYPLTREEMVERIEALLEQPDYGVSMYGNGLLVLQRGAGRGGTPAAQTMLDRYR